MRARMSARTRARAHERTHTRTHVRVRAHARTREVLARKRQDGGLYSYGLYSYGARKRQDGEESEGHDCPQAAAHARDAWALAHTVRAYRAMQSCWHAELHACVKFVAVPLCVGFYILYSLVALYRLSEAVILSTGAPMPAQWRCRRRCRYRADIDLPRLYFCKFAQFHSVAGFYIL